MHQFSDDKTKRGSVLIHFYPEEARVYTTLIQRQQYDGVHSGQISFPGGKIDPQDVDHVSAALREAREEVNISPDAVKVSGELSPLYISASDFLVYPVVSYSFQKPAFTAEPKEVAQIINFPLNILFSGEIKKKKTLFIRGHEIDAPYFDIYGNTVWGATAMILSELIEVLQQK